MRPELLREPRPHADDLAAKEAGRIDKVRAVSHEQIAAAVSFRVACGPFGLGAGHDGRLQIVGHGVAVRRIMVPRFERLEVAQFLADKLLREGEARIKAAVVAHQED